MTQVGKEPNSPEGIVRVGVDGERLSRPRYIRSHAALRGLAALVVVAYHLQFGTPHRLWIETATAFFQRGYLLVDLFFVLSGFVISLTSDADRTTRLSVGETCDFYVTRLARIYPLHLFCLCYVTVCTLGLAMLAQWHHGIRVFAFDPQGARSFVEELLLIQAWIPGAPHWNIPSWSISAEVFAYAVFPLLVALTIALPRMARGVFFIFPLLFYLWVSRGSGSLDFITGLAPFRCLSGFMLGMGLFHIRWSVARWSGTMLFFCQTISAAAIVAILAIGAPDPLIMPFFALLVVTTWQDRGPVSTLVCNRFLSWTGELSYSIYLNHVGLIAIITPFWYQAAARLGLSIDVSRIAFIITCFAAVLIVSQWTYAYVERPSRRYIRRIVARRALPGFAAGP